MLNRDFIFPNKTNGPINCISKDGKYYGDKTYTWNFLLHFPVLTIDFATNMTGVNLVEAAGSKEIAEANLLTIATQANNYIKSRVQQGAHKYIEFLIAKDEELLISVLIFQLEILKTWGGNESLYRVTDDYKGIGEAAIMAYNALGLNYNYFSFHISDEEYRKGY